MDYMTDEALEAIRQMQEEPFGLLLAKLRQEKGLSQADLAKLAGLSRPYVTQVENGTRTPTQETAVRLVTAMGFPPEGVLFMTGVITADTINRVQKIGELMALVQSRLTEEEWSRFESTVTDMGWMTDLAGEIASISDSPVAGVQLEPIPQWSALTPQNKRTIIELVGQLADTNRRESEVDPDAD